jgi:hypothetical protein
MESFLDDSREEQMVDSRELRTWFSTTEEEINITLLLVHAPLTFGHSQLTLSFPATSTDKEASRFDRAAQSIAKALRVFEAALEPSLCEFETLAKLTGTSGRYLKTLILRVSANEGSAEYKVHLVPYFESHDLACKKRFDSVHSAVSDERKGGLLGWLGQRETTVDSWQIDSDNPFHSHLDRIAIDCLGLGRLARKLHEIWGQDDDS